MNSKSQVSGLVSAWIASGMPKADIVINTAKACLDWSYVWGAVGADCTPSKREYYMGRSAIGDKDRENIKKACQVLNGSASSCHGCKWYPNDQLTLCNDCQGFCKNVFSRVGINFRGGGCTTMWMDDSNWTEKGKIADIPKDKVCLVFIAEGAKMSHVGIYIGNNKVIHCSHYVREGACPDKAWGWSHYAIPAGLYGDAPIKLPTLRRGDRGEYVTLAQTKLIQKGYSCGTKGADGIFGKATETAVKDFQRDHTDKDGKPLVVDGIIGQKTWDALLDTEPAILYTVIIKHLTEAQANTLISQYPGAEKQVERG